MELEVGERFKREGTYVHLWLIRVDAMPETWVRSLGWEDSLEKGTATLSTILSWRISWTLQSMGSQRVGSQLSDFHFHRRNQHNIVKQLSSNLQKMNYNSNTTQTGLGGYSLRKFSGERDDLIAASNQCFDFQPFPVCRLNCSLTSSSRHQAVCFTWGPCN